MIVEIVDTDEKGFLRIDLRDILRAVSTFGPSCQWILTRLEARGDVSVVWSKGMLDLEQAAASPGGVRFEWADLVRLSERLVQTIDCKIFASSSTSEGVLLTIEAIDSGCWRVSSDDPDVVAMVTRQFDKGVRIFPDCVE